MENPFLVISNRLSNIENLLLNANLQNQKTTEHKDDELLTTEQTAEFLSLSKFTLYGLINRREIPCMKRSKRVYFLKKDLLEYLQQGKMKTVSEIQSDAETFLSNKK